MEAVSVKHTEPCATLIHTHTHKHARTTSSVSVRVGVCGAQIKPGICTCLFMFSLEYCRKKWNIKIITSGRSRIFQTGCQPPFLGQFFQRMHGNENRLATVVLDDGFVKLMVGFLKYKKPSVAEKTT